MEKILILGKTEGKRRRAGRGYGYEIEQTPGDSAEKEMATHSSVLAWRIPGTWGCGRGGGEVRRGCGGLPSMGLHRVGHD